MKICLQASPSCAAVVLKVVAVFYLWRSRPGDNQALVWSTQKRQDWDVPGHRAPGRGWQQLPGENGQGWGVLLTRAGRSQTSQVSHHGVRSSRHCQLVHGGAGVWDDLECLRNPPFRGNTPVQRARQMKGRRAHRAFPSHVPWSVMHTVAGMDGATGLYNHSCGSEQSSTGWHAADIMKQPDQSILVKLLHANTDTLNGN